jgi:hypothetical protein
MGGFIPFATERNQRAQLLTDIRGERGRQWSSGLNLGKLFDLSSCKEEGKQAAQDKFAKRNVARMDFSHSLVSLRNAAVY